MACLGRTGGCQWSYKKVSVTSEKKKGLISGWQKDETEGLNSFKKLEGEKENETPVRGK